MQRSVQKWTCLLVCLALLFGVAPVLPGGAIFAQDSGMGSLAATLPQLPRPDSVTLEFQGMATWDAVSGCKGYTLDLYRYFAGNDTLVMRKTVGESALQYDFTGDLIKGGDGEYYYKISAKGDGVTTSDSAQVESHHVGYTPQVLLVTPEVLEWSADPATGDVLPKWFRYPDAARYIFTLLEMENGTSSILHQEIVSDAQASQSFDPSTFDADKIYVFTVQAIGSDIRQISQVSTSTAYWNGAVEGQLLACLQQAKNGDLPGAVARLKAIPTLDLTQALLNPANLDAYAEIEKLWMQANSITVAPVQVTTNKLTKGEIRVTGAAIHAASSSVQLTIADFNDLDLVNEYVNTDLYAAWVPLDFSLGGAPFSSLDFPIIVDMPLPKGMQDVGALYYISSPNGVREEVLPTVQKNSRVVFGINGTGLFLFAGNASPAADGTYVSERSADTKEVPEVPVTVDGSTLTVKGQTVASFVRLLHGAKGLTEGTDYTLRDIDGGVEVRLLLAPGTYDLTLKFFAAYAEATVTIDTASSPTGQQTAAAKVNPNTGRY